MVAKIEYSVCTGHTFFINSQIDTVLVDIYLLVSDYHPVRDCYSIGVYNYRDK